MKLNCDMGESFGSWTKGMDAEVMPYIDMANIACGFHASDPLTMDRTVRTAIAEKVAIGAHPGYPDLLGFGRRDMEFAPEELQALLVYQIAALDGICRTHGTAIEYIKPHGALYNKMAVDRTTLAAVMAAVRNFAPHCPWWPWQRPMPTRFWHWPPTWASMCGSRRFPTVPTATKAVWLNAR